jgi:hypothetical protein
LFLNVGKYLNFSFVPNLVPRPQYIVMVLLLLLLLVMIIINTSLLLIFMTLMPGIYNYIYLLVTKDVSRVHNVTDVLLLQHMVYAGLFL